MYPLRCVSWECRLTGRESSLAVFAVWLQKSRMIPICVDVTTVVWYNDREIAAPAENAQELQKKQRIMDIRFRRKAGLWAGWMRSKRSL